jgi:hypothetical protein
MALKRLKAGAPLVFHARFGCNPFWDLGYTADHTILWCKNGCGTIELERCNIDARDAIANESVCIVEKGRYFGILGLIAS